MARREGDPVAATKVEVFINGEKIQPWGDVDKVISEKCDKCGETKEGRLQSFCLNKQIITLCDGCFDEILSIINGGEIQ